MILLNEEWYGGVINFLLIVGVTAIALFICGIYFLSKWLFKKPPSKKNL